MKKETQDLLEDIQHNIAQRLTQGGQALHVKTEMVGQIKTIEKAIALSKVR